MSTAPTLQPVTEVLTRSVATRRLDRQPAPQTSPTASVSMFYSTLLLAATALTGLVSAQNYSTSGAIAVDPNSVDYDTRLSWCRAQTNSCPQICGGQAYPNTCDAVSWIATAT